MPPSRPTVNNEGRSSGAYGALNYAERTKPMKPIIAALGCYVVAASVVLAASREEQVAKYVKDLSSKDAATRKTAAEEIGKIAQVKAATAKPALQPLLDALDDRNGGVREAAALA